MTESRLLHYDACDVLMPMHLRISRLGQIVHAGPTIGKLRPAQGLVGSSFFDVFLLKRPSGVRSIDDLKAHASLRLTLQFRTDLQTTFKGVLVLDPTHDELIVNLSFGVSIIDAIHAYELVATDFAPTDLTVEMLYLIEAKTTILAEWQHLNERLESAKIAAEQQAFTDMLTGLKNRRAMDQVLGTMVQSGQPFGLIHLDLDFFKQVNDRHGHAIGDAVLQKAAEIMLRATRNSDTVIRAGGDEFIFILPHTLKPSSLVDLGNRLIRQLEVPIQIGDAKCRISASAGATAFWGESDLGAAELFSQADTALYVSKNAGRGCVTMFSPGRRETDGKALTDGGLVEGDAQR